MTVESASYISQLDTTLPAASNLISEGDDHLRLTKTVLKTQFPNFGTTAIAASAAEVNYCVGVTSAIQMQINGKGAIAGQAWTGTHSFAGATSVPTLAAGTSTTGAASTAFVQADFLQKFPNYTTPVSASTAELNHLVGVTSAIQPQLSNQVSGPINAATTKPTPADADELGITDSAASWGLKKITFANLKTWIGGLFVSKSGDTMTGQLISKKSFDNGASSSNFVAEAEGTAQGQAAGYSFRPTFTGTADNVPRRAADIWASFSGVWATERLSFGVGTGVANDGLNRTIERLAITGDGYVLVTGGVGLGYGAGSGGTVTQAGSIGAGVALNKPSMTINLFRAAWGVSEVREFFVSNSLVGPHDSVAVAIAETGISTSWFVFQILIPVVGGGFFIAARNMAGVALPDTQVTLKAQLIKGSAS